PLGECLSLAKKLVSENFEKTILARSFEDLLRILGNARKDKEPLDLVVLSLKLPECAGVEGLKTVRSVYEGPLMYLAGSADQRDVHSQQVGGADDSFVLTANPELFVLKVERLLVGRIMRSQWGQSQYRTETLFLNILG